MTHGLAILGRYGSIVHNLGGVVRPGSWARPAGASPVRVIAGEPGELGLALHPDKTRVVELEGGKEGFDFLGWHFRARMSGKLWEQERIIRYYHHRWPSVRSMKLARARVKAMTGRSQVGQQLEVVIARLNLFLRGWGNCFRTGNSAHKFVTLDRYVAWRLQRLLIKKQGRNIRAGQKDKWCETWFHDWGLHKLLGTIRYPKAA
jgi:RNA-directed DNA polymerase